MQRPRREESMGNEQSYLESDGLDIGTILWNMGHVLFYYYVG